MRSAVIRVGDLVAVRDPEDLSAPAQFQGRVVRVEDIVTIRGRNYFKQRVTIRLLRIEGRLVSALWFEKLEGVGSFMPISKEFQYI